MERFKKYFEWLPQTKQDWLFAEKWGLLTLVAFVVAFGLFLQCGGVFFYDTGEDCMQFSEMERSVIGGGIYSAAGCRKAQAAVIGWYRHSRGKQFILKDELLEAYRHTPCRVVAHDTSFYRRPTSKAGSAGSRSAGRIIPILQALENGLVQTVAVGLDTAVGAYEIIYLPGDSLGRDLAQGSSSEVPELCPVPPKSSGQKANDS